jgi:hypothetical protein
VRDLFLCFQVLLLVDGAVHNMTLKYNISHATFVNISVTGP